MLILAVRKREVVGRRRVGAEPGWELGAHAEDHGGRFGSKQRRIDAR